MSESLHVDLDDFTSSSLLAARFTAMIHSDSVSRPASVRQLIDPRASVFLRYEGEQAQRGPCLPMLQATAQYLHLAAQVDDDAREVFATVDAGFTGLPIDSDFARTWLERPVEVVDEETGKLYLGSSDDAITEAVYEALPSIHPEAALD